jgi:hypothetical protein
MKSAAVGLRQALNHTGVMKTLRSIALHKRSRRIFVPSRHGSIARCRLL